MSIHYAHEAAQTAGLGLIGEALNGLMAGVERSFAARSGKTLIQSIADADGWQAPAHDSETYRMLEAALASRGMPYRFRGGEGAHDGWSLLKACAEFATRRDCMDLIRSEPVVSEDEARMALLQWGMAPVRRRHASPGDVMLFALDGGVHGAVMSAAGGEFSWAMLPGRSRPEAKIIHAAPVRSVTECWAGPYWVDKLVEVYSFDRPRAPVREVLAEAA